MTEDSIIMIKKILNYLSESFGDAVRERRQYREKLKDLNRFNDDFAKSVSWTPVVKSRVRSSFCTKSLVISGNNKVSFRPSIQFLFFNLLFIGVPCLILLKVFVPGNFAFNDKWPLIPFMSLFLLIGIPYLLWELRPVYFDLDKRQFIKYTSHGYEIISMDDIHAIQMIKDDGHQDETYYELNLVLKNQNRLNIVCHNREKTIRKQAKQLSEILSVPFWDMTVV